MIERNVRFHDKFIIIVEILTCLLCSHAFRSFHLQGSLHSQQNDSIDFDLSTLPIDSHDFHIYNEYGNANGEINKFCNNNSCKIPCIFKGQQKIEIINKNNSIITQKDVICDAGSINCSTYQTFSICTFQNMHFISTNKGKIYTPYKVSLKKSEIRLNGLCNKEKPPFIVESVVGKIPERTKVRKGAYQYFLHSVNMHMVWHYVLEGFLPVWHSWFFHFGADKKIIPLTLTPKVFNGQLSSLYSFLFESDIKRIKPDTIYETFHVGVWGMYKSGYDPINKCRGPDYWFDHFGIDSFRKFIYEKSIIVMKKNKHPVIYICRRINGNRQISNFDDMYSNLTHYFKDAKFIIPNFYKVRGNKIASYMAEVDVLISIHGGDLVNSLFMRKSTSIVELHLYKFFKHDVYSELSNATGVNYFIWYPKKNPFPGSDAKWPERCKSEVCGGLNRCYMYNREQNLTVDIGAVVKTVGKALNKAGFNYDVDKLPGPGEIKGPGDDLSFS